MANSEHLRMLLAAIASTDCTLWNQWRRDNPNLTPDLREADFRKADLRLADLSAADLRRANLSNAVLAGAKLGGTKFEDANLCGADLRDADLKCAHLLRADLTGANLTGADLRYADLRGTNLTDAGLVDAKVDPVDLRRAINAKLGRTDSKGVGRQNMLASKSLVDAAVYKRLRSWIEAGSRLLAKAAPIFFKHEELVTLGLSKHEVPKEIQPAAPKAEPPDPRKPAQ